MRLSGTVGTCDIEPRSVIPDLDFKPCVPPCKMDPDGCGLGVFDGVQEKLLN